MYLEMDVRTVRSVPTTPRTVSDILIYVSVGVTVSEADVSVGLALLSGKSTRKREALWGGGKERKRRGKGERVEGWEGGTTVFY